MTIEKMSQDTNETIKPVDDDGLPFKNLPNEQQSIFIEVMTRSGLNVEKLMALKADPEK